MRVYRGLPQKKWQREGEKKREKREKRRETKENRVLRKRTRGS